MGNARVEAFAPASAANIGVGFDILGLAIDGLGDTVLVEKRPQRGAVMASITGDNGKLPCEADKNTSSVAANALLQMVDADFGVEIHLKKGLPLGSGLGSSAASAVVAVVAVNALLDEPLPKEQLLASCLEGEAVVSGYHADNIGPSLFGGITLITGTQAHQIHHLPVPQNLHLALVTPDVVVPTVEARAVLPKKITLKQMVQQTGAVAQLVDAIYRGDIEAMAYAMQLDTVIEPARQHLMPFMREVRKSAEQAGAMNLVISGAGPTLCSICESKRVAQNVIEAMKQVYDNENIKCMVHATQVCMDGARIL